MRIINWGYLLEIGEKKSEANRFRSEQGSNLRGETPLDFKSNALTTRPSLPRREKEGGDTLVLKWPGLWLPDFLSAHFKNPSDNGDCAWLTVVMRILLSSLSNMLQ